MIKGLDRVMRYICNPRYSESVAEKPTENLNEARQNLRFRLEEVRRDLAYQSNYRARLFDDIYKKGLRSVLDS
ncbi:MAG: hypothetical protein Q7S74_01015 [Nanoarchaeota archaeon]|nr:hypothetical protein [Nanoarchaeota archaeon]